MPHRAHDLVIPDGLRIVCVIQKMRGQENSMFIEPRINRVKGVNNRDVRIDIDYLLKALICQVFEIRPFNSRANFYNTMFEDPAVNV